MAAPKYLARIFSIGYLSAVLMANGCAFKKHSLQTNPSEVTQVQTASPYIEKLDDYLISILKEDEISDLLIQLDKYSLPDLDRKLNSEQTALEIGFTRGSEDLLDYLLRRGVSPFRVSAETLENQNAPSLAEKVKAAQINALNVLKSKIRNSEINLLLQSVRDQEAGNLGCLAILSGLFEARYEKGIKKTDFDVTQNKIVVLLKDQTCLNISILKETKALSGQWLSNEIVSTYALNLTSDLSLAELIIDTFHPSLINLVGLNDGNEYSPLFLIQASRGCKYTQNPARAEFLKKIAGVDYNQGKYSDIPCTAYMTDVVFHSAKDLEELSKTTSIGGMQEIQDQMDQAPEVKKRNLENLMKSFNIHQAAAMDCEGMYE